ncbi:MAG: tRNA (N(6)-L-threonylcarbamoyladenosine(37)-C(2))-methylthiotransferase MtaB [Chloroflexota bacterium]|nr:tRNA (N(6)-L-threonylcarbamoyladenosine(37)-C(2))-methylthiotransferase MtaB [Chloroflexota bacterium]
MSTPSNPAPLDFTMPEQGSVEPASVAGRVAIHTHGCKLNQADSSVLARQFRQAGYILVNDVRDADIFVLNTCTVTSTADSKARRSLRAASRANPDAVVVAAGCYPQRAAEELDRMEAVSLVVGNEDKHQLASLAVAAHRKKLGLSTEPPEFGGSQIAKMEVSGKLPGRTRGMVKIQEGCDQVCAYCIVPKVRGRERSIPPEEIVRQVQQKVEEGCREVTLTGTQLGTYGFDLADTDLRNLIRRVLDETELARLRVSSLQPQEINRELLDLWLADSRLCPHFHVPLQSGCDNTLRAMRRRYDTGRFAKTVSLIRQAIPDSGITADLIVGFPGEEARQFEESLAFAAEMAFSDMHLFPYSRRPGTSAVYLEGHVTETEKRERMGRAQQVARHSFNLFRRGQLGATRPVLWEGAENGVNGGRWKGLTDNYIRVLASPTDSEDSQRILPNTITQARLTELRGEMVVAVPVS